MSTQFTQPHEQEVALSGVREEFRIALREEIEAAKRAAASGGIQLLNGRRLGRSADAHQYVFTLESALNLPDDSPGDLHIAGRRPVETTIVAVEGLAITVSVAEDLGDFVPRASLHSDLTHLLRTLIKRIENSAQQPNPAGDRLLGQVEPQGEPETERVVGLNAQQADAVASSLGRNATFVWGPPGTGKTRTIGMIGEQLVRRERALLVVSHTNSAVDQAVLAIEDDLGDDLVDGSVLRLGQPRDQRLLEAPHDRLLAETHIKERSQELLDREAELNGQRLEATARLREVERLIGLAEWLAQVEDELLRLRALQRDTVNAQVAVDQAAQRTAELEARVDEWRELAALARELSVRIEQAEPLKEEVTRRERLLTPAEQRLHTAEQSVREATALHEHVVATNPMMRRLRGLPRPEEQSAVVARCRAEESSAGEERDAVLRRLAEVREPLYALEEERRAFEAEHGRRLPDVLRAASEHEAAAEDARTQVKLLERSAEQLDERLSTQLSERMQVLRGWGVSTTRGADTNELIEAITEAQQTARDALAGLDVASLRLRRTELQTQLREIAEELAEIEEALQRVEFDVIANALVVATTLTRAYKRDSVQARRFDTVILDEASMAPIPALWVVAGLADASVVVVGDFKQLAPIKHSEHSLAKKWLGRDVFDVSGVRGRWDRRDPPENLVQLQVQYRMHSQISAIPNALVYEGSLSDGEGVDDDSALDGWYDRSFEYDAPVLLVDMAPLNAWVTSVKNAGRSSRLNFLSAVVSVDLAERLLLPDRPKLALGSRPRILIGAPYRPQTRLVNLLIKDEGLEREVVPGTAHTFQGSEAPVMIFDFVLDEPHRQAGLFDPANNDDVARLLNVALTRARRRLIVLADFAWVEQKANRLSKLRELVGFLKEHYPLVSAADVIPTGLHSRAAEAHQHMVGDDDAPSHRRIVVTQDDYYPLLVRDIDAAARRVVVFSPFLTPDRIGMLEPHLRAAVERGVRVYLLTKTLGERAAGAVEGARTVERALTGWGVTVIHKFHMHEKLVFIDEDMLWSGSLNSFSFTDTQEVMERRVSRPVFEDYARVLRLETLLGVYDEGQGVCPICGGELVAAESKNGDPFYWRCLVLDCYTRSLDRPAPRNGLIPCAACGAAVEFREMPTGPFWRCTENHRHRQRVAASHLRLPRMRELIPKRDLAKLERWGLGVARVTA